jgi:Tannase and feruloyl esterase
MNGCEGPGSGFVSGLIASCRKSGAPLAALTVVLLSSVAIGPARAAAADCATLSRLMLKDTTVTSATITPAADPVPEYCKVDGEIRNLPHSTIHFEIGLPTTRWNGKYLLAGGGGFNGFMPKLDQGLAEGYATIGSDTGHVGKDMGLRGGVAADASWALNNLDAQNNYAYLATHVVALLGKQILRAFYGQRERRSYYEGCSNGGKMGLMEVQRYPNDFDGVISGDPVIDRTKLMVSYTWNEQALAKAPIPPGKLPVIDKATMAACRESGGVIDGVIMTPGRCRFDPQTIVCRSGDGPNCLTPGQSVALQRILRGPVNSAGEQIFPGYPPGHEADDYENRITGDGNRSGWPGFQWAMQDNFMKYFVFGPSYDPVKQFNFDRDMAAMVPLAITQDGASPDLSEFKAHGGKFIIYNGWADHSITPIRSIEYYAEVIDAMGGRGDQPGEVNPEAVTDFFRLFMEPGMHHCAGGPGPDRFNGANQGFPPTMDAQHDVLMALDRWVEDGVAPEKIIASHLANGKVDRTLPICPYPQVPVYNGAGETRMAESYHCEFRNFWWPVEAISGVKKPSWGKVAAPRQSLRRSGR